jgi:hypothetical protein
MNSGNLRSARRRSLVGTFEGNDFRSVLLFVENQRFLSHTMQQKILL